MEIPSLLANLLLLAVAIRWPISPKGLYQEFPFVVFLAAKSACCVAEPSLSEQEHILPKQMADLAFPQELHKPKRCAFLENTGSAYY